MPKAFAFTEYGGPETQSFVDLPPLSPGPGQLLVAVRAAGVNPVDWKYRAGYLREVVDLPLPAVFGSEVAGVVAQVGAGVEDFTVGDAVFGRPATGGYTEFTLVPVGAVARKPEKVSFAQAATLPVAACAAYAGLERMSLEAGATLLVVGVGGGVGVAVAQIARSRGVRVLGTASPDKEDFVSSLGVTHVTYGEGVADRVRLAAPDGVDAVFDLVGGSAVEDLAGLFADGSALFTAVDPAVAAKYDGTMIFGSPDPETLAAVGHLVEAGVLDPHITATYPLDCAADALRAVESGHARGKVVIEVS